MPLTLTELLHVQHLVVTKLTPSPQPLVRSLLPASDGERRGVGPLGDRHQCTVVSDARRLWMQIFKERHLSLSLEQYCSKQTQQKASLPPHVLAGLPEASARFVRFWCAKHNVDPCEPPSDNRREATTKRARLVKKKFDSDTFAASFQALWSERQEQEAKARIQALKDNDPEAYLAHLGSEKMSSLLHIMDMTHNFMLQVGAKLEAQQERTAPTSLPQPAQTSVTATNEYKRFQAYVNSAKDEYKLVHRTSTFVATQPAGLEATLMAHQLVGLRFLASLHANHINGILADEMGVGKTIQTLAFLLHLKELAAKTGAATTRAAGVPHLVLAPLSIVREWREACAQFVPNSMRVGELCDILKLEANSSESIAANRIKGEYDIVLLAVHRVRTFGPLLSKVQWGYVVVDEAHKAVSNLHTITAQSICSIPYQHRLVLTGTPLNSDLQELWSLLHFINPHIFSEVKSFDDVFRRPFQSHISVGGKDAAVALQLTDEERALLVMRMHQVLRPFMLRRTKRDIDSKLRISFHEVRCPLSAPQQMLLTRLEEERQLPVVIDGACVSRSILTVESSAQAICNHAFMVPFFSQVLHRETVKCEQVGPSDQNQMTEDEGTLQCTKAKATQAVALGCSGKFIVLDLILRRARSVNVKTVIFTHWLDCMDLLSEYFDAQGWHNGSQYVVLNGSSTAEERKECVERFRNDPQCLIFLVSVKAGGCGLNLQVAHLIVMLDKDYTGTNEDQAIARVFRIGQRHVVRAVHLVTDHPCEQRIAAIAERKDKPRHAIIEGGGYRTEVTTEEERRDALEHAMRTGPAEVIDARDIQRLDSCAFDSLIVPTLAEEDIMSAAASTSPLDDVTNNPPPPPLSEDHRSLSVAEQLRSNSVDVLGTLFATAESVPQVLRDAFAESKRPEISADDLGRGKRDRSDFSVDEFPPDSFWDKWAEHGLDDEEIHAKWKEIIMKRRELSRLCSVSFTHSEKTVEVRIEPNVGAETASAAGAACWSKKRLPVPAFGS